MKIYDVFNPELNTNVWFNVLNEQETQQLVFKYKSSSQDEFMRAVLEASVVNLKTEIAAAIKKIPKEDAKNILYTLYNCCIMLNPALDVITWLQIANSPLLINTPTINELPAASTSSARKETTRTVKKKSTINRLSRIRFLNLERHLKENVIGQDEAIEELVKALKRSHVGLNDEDRPLGVFLFSGASGVGKTLVAKELHKYLYGNSDIVRIDCGEFQHKHENQKLMGSPPGYISHDEGGQLTNAMSKTPNTVVLLDEVEKAHPDIWNTFLRVFDEGWLTDGAGKKVSFHNAIIIMTTNLGNQDIVDDIQERKFGFQSEKMNNAVMRDRVVRVTNDAIKKFFRPEFINRIDKTIVFNHLTQEDYRRIAKIELQTVETKLEKRGYILTYNDNVIDGLIQNGVDNIQGARGLSQVRRDKIEDNLADILISKRFAKGTVFHINYADNEFIIETHIQRTQRKKEVPEIGSPSNIIPFN